MCPRWLNKVLHVGDAAVFALCVQIGSTHLHWDAGTRVNLTFHSPWAHHLSGLQRDYLSRTSHREVFISYGEKKKMCVHLTVMLFYLHRGASGPHGKGFWFLFLPLSWSEQLLCQQLWWRTCENMGYTEMGCCDGTYIASGNVLDVQNVDLEFLHLLWSAANPTRFVNDFPLSCPCCGF